MLWELSYPVRKIELFLKLALPTKQVRSLKTICKKLHSFIAFANGKTDILLEKNSQWLFQLINV